MRLRSAAVTIGLILTSLTAACSDDEPDWSQVCKDKFTDLRIEDRECEADSSGSRTVWIYYPGSYSAPAVGSKVSGGTTTRPASGTFGTVPSKGGFGGFVGS